MGSQQIGPRHFGGGRSSNTLDESSESLSQSALQAHLLQQIGEPRVAAGDLGIPEHDD
jgi:hypothetical protein